MARSVIERSSPPFGAHDLLFPNFRLAAAATAATTGQGGMGGGFFSRAEKHLHGNEGLTSGEENDVKLPEHDSLSSNELAAATARAIVPQQYASYA